MLMIYLTLLLSSFDVNMFVDDTELHFSQIITVEQTLQADVQNVSV